MSEPVREPPLWHGWRKAPGGAFERVAGCEGTKGDCWAFLSRLHFVGTSEDGCQYTVLPAGERPAAQEYLTRDMRAWR